MNQAPHRHHTPNFFRTGHSSRAVPSTTPANMIMKTFFLVNDSTSILLNNLGALVKAAFRGQEEAAQ